MMIRVASCLAMGLLVAVLAGCEAPAEKMVFCEECGKDMPVGTFCPKCMMVMGEKGTVHCDKCNADMPAGKWCQKCNRVMLAGTVTCCGKEVPNGSYCEKCKGYVGVPGVGYCEKCKKPYPKATGCPMCTVKAAG